MAVPTYSEGLDIPSRRPGASGRIAIAVLAVMMLGLLIAHFQLVAWLALAVVVGAGSVVGIEWVMRRAVPPEHDRAQPGFPLR